MEYGSDLDLFLQTLSLHYPGRFLTLLLRMTNVLSPMEWTKRHYTEGKLSMSVWSAFI